MGEFWKIGFQHEGKEHIVRTTNIFKAACQALDRLRESHPDQNAVFCIHGHSDNSGSCEWCGGFCVERFCSTECYEDFEKRKDDVPHDAQ